MAIVRKFSRLLRTRLVVLMLIFFVISSLVLLLFNGAYYLAVELATNFIAEHHEFGQNKLNVYFVTFYNFRRDRRWQFRYEVEHERLEKLEVNASDVFDNYYDEEAEDAIKGSLKLFLTNDVDDERRTRNGWRPTRTYTKPQPQYQPPFCPAFPPNLKGRLKFSSLLSQLQHGNGADEEQFDYVEIGGHSMPKNCSARHRVAILVPYLDRPDMLAIFPKYMHLFLRSQMIDYAIYVVEQSGDQTFNRGKVLNAGAIEALKLYDWQCFIFHDVDHFPVDDRNLYTCPQEARRMAANIYKFHFNLRYREYFGGVSAVNESVFTKIDGFSNDFWGWGGEDDDIFDRLKRNGFRIYRYPQLIAKYITVKHERDKENRVNDCSGKLLEATRNGLWPESGLRSVRYVVERIDFQPLYTRIVVDLLEKEERSKTAELTAKICANLTSTAEVTAQAGINR